MPRTIRRNESPRGYSSTTPDMNLIKTEVNSEFMTSPHLLDHGYGATPQNQVSISTPNAPAPVKRKLNLESSRNYIVPLKQEFKPPQPKKPKRATPLKRNTRYDTSLGLLTQKFSALLENSPNGVVDLNKASQELNVQKRRIYDITNVLEGIGIIEKKSKNNIQWKGGRKDHKKIVNLTNEVQMLEEQENNLDCLIRIAEHELKKLNNDRHGFVTYQDLRSIERFKQNTVIVVKAPPEARLSVSPATGNEEKHNIQVKSTSAEIQVFLCPDYASPNVKSKAAASMDLKFSPYFDMSTPPVPQLDSPTRQISAQICRNLSFSKEPSSISATSPVQNTLPFINPPPLHRHHQPLKVEEEDDSLRLSPLMGSYQTCLGSSAQNSNRSEPPFINDNEVLGPMVGTCYPSLQQQMGSTQTGFMDPFFAEPFLHLEPVIQSDYNFSLDSTEGLVDLFSDFL